MDENNTTPEPNVPDKNEDSKEPTAYFDLNKKFGPNSYRGKNRFEKEPVYDWHMHSEKQTKINKPELSAYEEIVDDLIDIISKLLKELSKRK